MAPTTIHLSSHAIARFRERVRPALGDQEAADELARLALVGHVTTSPPAWHLAACAQLAPAYLLIGDVLLPLQPHRVTAGAFVATTCLTRAERSADVYARRRRARARRRLRAAA